MGLFDFWEKGWDDISGNTARRRQEKQMQQIQQNNAAALTAEQTAQEDTLDFQKVLAYFQLQQANQQNQQSNTLMGQQLAGTLAGEQQAANQFAQLYNQDLTNNLPQMQARLAAMQALGPLMQMTGLQAYQMPTSLDTTKLVAPDIIGQFDTLSSKYASQYNNPALQQAQQQQSADFLKAMSDPAAWLASQGNAGTAGTTLPPNIRASVQPIEDAQIVSGPAGSIRVPPSTTNAAAQQAAAGGAPAAAGAATPVYNPATAQPTMTNLQAVSGPLQGSQLETDPIYQFRLQQAQRELANQLSRRGLGTGGLAAAKKARGRADKIGPGADPEVGKTIQAQEDELAKLEATLGDAGAHDGLRQALEGQRLATDKATQAEADAKAKHQAEKDALDKLVVTSCGSLAEAASEILPSGVVVVDFDTMTISWARDGRPTVARAALSGGERAVFDAALGRAIVGKAGVILVEGAECDGATFTDLLNYIGQHEGGGQTVVAHWLTQVKAPDGWAQVRMG